MTKFRDVLDECGFLDFGFIGHPFIWCNNRLDTHKVWVWLDKALALSEWLRHFPETRYG